MSKIYPRMLTSPKGSFFLFGMRGSGKSTWVKASTKDYHSINLLDEELYQSILTNPLLFSGQLQTLRPGSWVFVDEIQRIPSLLNEVHRWIEEKRLKFVLTGSSARKLRKGGVNLLGGRALVKNLFPLLPEEMGPDFHLDETLAYGSLALVVSTENPKKDTLKSYVQTYLKQEIQAEALVRNLQGFARFLPVAGLYHGQTISISNIARECGVERTTVAGYLNILEDTLIVFRLPAFEAKLRVRERTHPKLYWLDNGVARAAKGYLGEVAPEEKGALFEAWVGQLLHAYVHYRDLADKLYYWAPTKTVEVDFLLTSGKEFCAIEAKASKNIHNDFCKGLRAIQGLEGLKKRYLVYLGREILRTEDGIDIVPAMDFARRLADQKIW